METILTKPECVICFGEITENDFSNSEYVIMPSCYCIYDIHYECLFKYIRFKNCCLLCEKPFSVYKAKYTKRRFKEKVKGLFCCCS